MEWANRFLTSSSSSSSSSSPGGGVKKPVIAVLNYTSSFSVDPLRSRNAFMHQHVDIVTGSRQDDIVASLSSSSSSTLTSSAAAQAAQPEAQKFATGNGNSRSSGSTHSSCAVEHRVSTPVRTVSISRSGRYKSKSKHRSRLLNADVIDHQTSGAATPSNGFFPAERSPAAVAAAASAQSYRRESDPAERQSDEARSVTVETTTTPMTSPVDPTPMSGDEGGAEQSPMMTTTTTMNEGGAGVVSTTSGVGDGGDDGDGLSSVDGGNDVTVVEHLVVPANDLYCCLTVAFESTDL